MRAFIGAGSNIDPEKNLPAALERLIREESVTVLSVSPVYRTAALGSIGGRGEFLNGVFAIETDLEPRNLKFDVLRLLEEELGRFPGARRGPRTIDLDLLAYGERVIKDEDLEVPDPDWLERPFIAVPLAELAPDLVHPVCGQTASAIADRMDTSGLMVDAGGSERLRRLLAGRNQETGGGG